jgi:monoterpene epsilon-lactone hydrolase
MSPVRLPGEAPTSEIAPTDAWSRTLRNAPTPGTISYPAQRLLAAGLPLPEAGAMTVDEHRQICAAIQVEIGARQCAAYGVQVEDAEIAGVPVRLFTPRDLGPGGEERVLMNLHGGGFIKDSGSLTENIPIAGLTRSRVVAVRYRLAPEHPFPAAVDDAEAVYSALIDDVGPAGIALYGTSAGAILSAQTIMRLKAKGLPMPCALGFFSGAADLSKSGDSEHFFPLIDDPRPLTQIIGTYLDGHDTCDPAISPMRGALGGLPPTLCITGTRDLMLSQTALFHCALLRSGVDARLVVFEAMPHAHWSYLEIPESDEAFRLMAAFLEEQLGSSAA